MRALVTGGAGFIGSHTVDALIEKGHEVTILDSLEKPVHLSGMPEYLNKDARFVQGDVRNRVDFSKALEGRGGIPLCGVSGLSYGLFKFFSVNAWARRCYTSLSWKRGCLSKGDSRVLAGRLRGRQVRFKCMDDGTFIYPTLERKKTSGQATGKSMPAVRRPAQSSRNR